MLGARQKFSSIILFALFRNLLAVSNHKSGIKLCNNKAFDNFFLPPLIIFKQLLVFGRGTVRKRKKPEDITIMGLFIWSTA